MTNREWIMSLFVQLTDEELYDLFDDVTAGANLLGPDPLCTMCLERKKTKDGRCPYEDNCSIVDEDEETQNAFKRSWMQAEFKPEDYKNGEIYKEWKLR